MKKLLRNPFYLATAFAAIVLVASLLSAKKKSNRYFQNDEQEQIRSYIKNSIENINSNQVYILNSTPDSPIKKELILKVNKVVGGKIEMLRFSNEKFINMNAFLSVKEIIKNKSNLKALSFSKQDLINAVRKTDGFEEISKSDFHFEGNKYWISNVYNMTAPFFEVQKLQKELNDKVDGFVLINYGRKGSILSVKPIKDDVKIVTKFPKKFSYFNNSGNQECIVKVETANLSYQKHYDFDMEVLDSLNQKQMYKIHLYKNDNSVNRLK